MSIEPEKVDVLVLGAGLSGLSAAFRLQERSPELTFLVAEANDRIGGRTLSASVENPCSSGQYDTLDLGAHWVCDRQKDIMQLIQKLGGIEYYPQNVSGNYFSYCTVCEKYCPAYTISYSGPYLQNLIFYET